MPRLSYKFYILVAGLTFVLAFPFFSISPRKEIIRIVGCFSNADVATQRQAAAQVDPDLMRHVPLKYDPEYLNPCWDDDGVLSCLPYVYIGGYHSGAVSLAKKLAVHPRVPADVGSLNSSGFWSRSDGLVDDFLGTIRKAASSKLLASPADAIVMDGSQSNLMLHWSGSSRAHHAHLLEMGRCQRGCTGNSRENRGNERYRRCIEKCLAEARRADENAAKEAMLPYSDLQLPMLMRAFYGERSPKFIFLLRNPIHRIYSAFFGTQALTDRYGNSLPGFTKFVADQYGGYRNCTRRHSEEDCILRFESLGSDEAGVFSHAEQLLRGMYSTHLKIWFRYFSRGSFLILDSAEFFHSNQATMKRVFEFLGFPIPPDDDSPLWHEIEAAGPRVTYTQEVGWVIPEGARRVLSKLYERHNSDLADLLGDKRWEASWNLDTLVCPPSC